VFPEPFALERFFARHEFSARYLLSSSDCQGLPMADLVDGADEELRARWDGLQLGYTESQGLPELREAIAGLYESAKADKVLIAAPEELIFLAMNALLEPGDHVICTFPGYQSLYGLARGMGCQVSLWEPAEGETWRFDPADLETLLRPDTKLVVWNFPHNPTGALPPRTDYDLMIAAAARVGARVFSDEMYRLLEPCEEVRLPAAVDRYPEAVSLSGMSKAFGLAGLRIGWVVTHDEPLLERMKALKDYTTICSSAPSELLALMALRSRDAILAGNRDRVRRNLEVAKAFFSRHERTLGWIPPRAGTVCFPRLVQGSTVAGTGRAAGGAESGVARGAEAFCGRVLSETGVLLLPSTVYEYGDSHFRMGLGRDDFPIGLDALDAFLTSAPGP
jgi:aspartate/methionine/tyrosine aminotransferase